VVLEELVRSLHDAGIAFALVDVRAPFSNGARRTGLLEAIGEDRVVHTVQEAIDALATPT
jgi:hypothetical protein